MLYGGSTQFFLILTEPKTLPKLLERPALMVDLSFLVLFRLMVVTYSPFLFAVFVMSAPTPPLLLIYSTSSLSDRELTVKPSVTSVSSI